jgi:hypothetical protein
MRSLLAMYGVDGVNGARDDTGDGGVDTGGGGGA